MGGASSRPVRRRRSTYAAKRPTAARSPEYYLIYDTYDNSPPPRHVPMRLPTSRPKFCRVCNYEPLESRPTRCVFRGAHYLEPDNNWRQSEPEENWRQSEPDDNRTQPLPDRLKFDGSVPVEGYTGIATEIGFLTELQRQANNAFDLYDNGEEAPYIHPILIGDCYDEVYGDMPRLFEQGPENKKTWIALSNYWNPNSPGAHAWVTVVVKSADGNARRIYFGDCDKDITRVAGRKPSDVLEPGQEVILRAALRHRRFTGTTYVYIGQRGFYRENRCLESACGCLAEIGMMADKAYTVGVDDERFAGFVKVFQRSHRTHSGPRSRGVPRLVSWFA